VLPFSISANESAGAPVFDQHLHLCRNTPLHTVDLWAPMCAPGPDRSTPARGGKAIFVSFGPEPEHLAKVKALVRPTFSGISNPPRPGLYLPLPSGPGSGTEGPTSAPWQSGTYNLDSP
jgi:hypothetical protein